MAAPSLQPDIQNAIELLRVSTDVQDVGRQRADMQKLSKRFPTVRTARTLELIGVSGTAVLSNVEMQRLLTDLEDPKIHGVKISSIDRLLRPKAFETVRLFDYFVNNRKVIWSQREGLVDPATDQGFETCMNAATRAGAEWRLLKQRSADGRADKVAEGKLVSPVHVYGYEYVPKHLKTEKRCERCATPNADLKDLSCGQFLKFGEQAKLDIVLQTFRDRAKRVNTYTLAMNLNNAGIKSEKGGLWSRQTILQMLRRTAYNGRYIYKGETLPCPKLIDDELWATVHDSAEGIKRQWQGRPSDIYLLRGFVWCHRCGHRVITNRSTGVGGKINRYYRCGHVNNHPPQKRLCPALSVEQRLLEQVAWAAIWGLLTDADLLIKLARIYYDALAKPGEIGVDKLRKEAASLEADEKQLIAMCKRRMITIDDAAADLRRIRDRRAQVEVDLRSAGQLFEIPSARAAEAALSRIRTGKEPTTYEGRRGILEKIHDLRMVFSDDNGVLEIEGKVPVADAVKSADCLRKKVNRRLDDSYSSVLAIPFKLKVEVRAA